MVCWAGLVVRWPETVASLKPLFWQQDVLAKLLAAGKLWEHCCFACCTAVLVLEWQTD